MWQHHKITELEEVIRQKNKDIANLYTIIESLETIINLTTNELQIKV